MNKLRTTYKLFPTWNIVGLAVISLLITWLLAYQRVLEYMTEQGANIEELGRNYILLSLLNGTVIVFSILVFITAGIIPFLAVLFKPSQKVSEISQIVWALSIVLILYAFKVTS